jgi:hypothetical protein
MSAVGNGNPPAALARPSKVFQLWPGTAGRLPRYAYPKEISPITVDTEIKLQLGREHLPGVQRKNAAVLQPEPLFFAQSFLLLKNGWERP